MGIHIASAPSSSNCRTIPLVATRPISTAFFKGSAATASVLTWALTGGTGAAWDHAAAQAALKTKAIVVWLRCDMGCLSSHHGVTSCSADLAGFGTVFAVIHVVFRAFGATRLAGLGAQRADRVALCALTRDGGCCQSTNVSTFQIQRNASGHRLWLIFIQASRCALEARSSTVIASAKTINLFLTQHVHFLWVLPKIRCLNLSENEEGRRCVSAQRLGDDFSVSQTAEIGLRVLPHRWLLMAGVTSTLQISHFLLSA